MHARPLALSPHVFVRDAEAAVAFYADAFGATELVRNTTPDGKVIFVELAFGPAKLLVSEEVAELGALGPESIGGSPVVLTLEFEDLDGAVARALERGAKVEMPVEEMFWGERYGIVRDPEGHRWAMCTRREVLDPDEVAARTPKRIPPR